MNISVYRDSGLIDGVPVVEPLLADSVLLERGISEINANSQQFNQVVASIVYRDGIRLGQIVSVANPTGNYYGKITGISFELSHGNAQLRLNIERLL